MRHLSLILILFIFQSCMKPKEIIEKKSFEPFTPPISYEVAQKQADSLIAQMSLQEKIAMIGGFDMFFVKGYEELGIPQLYLSDATQGVHIRSELDDQLEKSTAFPSPISLTSTWNPSLARQIATCIGEECRAGDIAVLLGPGMNIYRISQNGRNFEYFGEDPFLAARFIENYVVGMQETGTIATLKHFIANNTDYYRRTSNSVVAERALREIYMPAFEAGVNAGVMAVMTSYNQVNGEWAGQSDYVINQLLRKDLGFKWLVMSDWWSIWDAEKAIKSGLDLDMAGEAADWMPAVASKDEFYLKLMAEKLINEGKVEEADITRMVRNILTTEIAMGLLERPVKDESYLSKFDEHTQVALQIAREGIVLLKNNGILPLNASDSYSILVTGKYLDKMPMGGGSAAVEGFDIVTLRMALEDAFGDNVNFIESPTKKQLTNADVVIYSTGTSDSEGWDRAFDLPKDEEDDIRRVVDLNENTIIVVNSGGGINMSGWNDKAAAIVYGWYPGQIGFRALAEIMTGETNPSGKLPITIEKDFKDSPGFGYIPEDREIYTGWGPDMDMASPVYDVNYDEGVFVGYRWYEAKDIEPLYAFGHGLSYTTYAYSNLKVSSESIRSDEAVKVTCEVTNSGTFDGMEIVQLYVSDKDASVERPIKELKGTMKVALKQGETKTVEFILADRDFAFWDETNDNWKVEPGEFELLVGSASNNILLRKNIVIE